MDYEDVSLEAMSREELLVAAKHLRDRIRDGYNYLITGYGDRIKSAKTGEFVSFNEFIEHGNFKARLAEYVRVKLSQ
jgi:phage head maturation protease